jgi:hypothetical protein
MDYMVIYNQNDKNLHKLKKSNLAKKKKLMRMRKEERNDEVYIEFLQPLD